MNDVPLREDLPVCSQQLVFLCMQDYYSCYTPPSSLVMCHVRTSSISGLICRYAAKYFSSGDPLDTSFAVAVIILSTAAMSKQNPIATAHICCAHLWFVGHLLYLPSFI